MLSTYVPKQLGKYSFNVCKDTKYFCALGMLQTHNDEYEKKKKKRMIEYISRKTFMKQLICDFDKISHDKKLDYTYLKNLCEDITGRTVRPSQLSTLSDQTPIDELKKFAKRYKIQNIWYVELIADIIK